VNVKFHSLCYILRTTIFILVVVITLGDFKFGVTRVLNNNRVEKNNSTKN